MEDIKQNKMAVMPVKKLMLSMGIPMVISMVLQAVYNIVDSAFVSNMSSYGEEGLNALTLAFPMQMLMVAISIGTGVGANALMSKALGAGDREKASRTAGNAAFLAVIVCAAFILLGLFGVEVYIKTQTSNQTVLGMAVSYLRICCVGSVGIVFFSIYEKLLQAGGHSLYSTIAQISGAVVNIVLDPIMIYGLFGCTERGVSGAAYATIIGQIVSFVLAFVFHIKVNKSISNAPRYFVPSKRIIKGIYAVCFVFAGANIAYQGVFQALDGGFESFAISVCRQVIFLFPFVFVFAEIAKRNSVLRMLVWTSFPICEILSCAVAILLYKRILKNKLQ